MAINISYDLPALLAGFAAYQGGTAGGTTRAADQRAQQNAQFQALTAAGVNQGFGTGAQLYRDQQANRYQVARDATMHGYDMDRLAAQNRADLDHQAFSATGMTYDDLRSTAAAQNATVPQLIDARQRQRLQNAEDIQTTGAIERSAGMLPYEVQRAREVGAVNADIAREQFDYQQRASEEAALRNYGLQRGLSESQFAELRNLDQREQQLRNNERLSPGDVKTGVANIRKLRRDILENPALKPAELTPQQKYEASSYERPDGSTWILDGRLSAPPAQSLYLNAYEASMRGISGAWSIALSTAAANGDNAALNRITEAMNQQAIMSAQSVVQQAQFQNPKAMNDQMGPPAPPQPAVPRIPQPQPQPAVQPEQPGAPRTVFENPQFQERNQIKRRLAALEQEYGSDPSKYPSDAYNELRATLARLNEINKAVVR